MQFNAFMHLCSFIIYAFMQRGISLIILRLTLWPDLFSVDLLSGFSSEEQAQDPKMTNC